MRRDMDRQSLLNSICHLLLGSENRPLLQKQIGYRLTTCLQYGVLQSRRRQVWLSFLLFCVSSSIGRALPCHGRGCGFKSRFALQFEKHQSPSSLWHLPSKQNITGANPVWCSNANIVQSVERRLPKPNVADSSSAVRSILFAAAQGVPINTWKVHTPRAALQFQGHIGFLLPRKRHFSPRNIYSSPFPF